GYGSSGRFGGVPAKNTPRGFCKNHFAMSARPTGGGGGGPPPPPIPKKCKVEVGREINVKLGSVALKNFPRVNDTSTERSFDISLSECAALAKPEIAFRDKYVSAQQADPTILSLKSGGAAGFGIVVKNGLDQQRIRFDGTPYPMRRVGDSADLPLSAAYIRIGAEGELKAGVADGAAEFTFTFP
ncbi:fimbrial protein, partial [Pseudomonas aeruginosa]|uniref:fimbrial protein n=1 Tax=Pseudomonas aeruginosa TaxID=287 RepID=UPI0039BE11B1